MKRLMTCVLAVVLACTGGAGCAEKESAKKETTISTPGGKTTITTESEVKKTGKNPPGATP